MKDSINSAYMGQERIAQTIPCMSTSNKPSYVSYFQICRHLHKISMVTIQLRHDLNSYCLSKLKEASHYCMSKKRNRPNSLACKVGRASQTAHLEHSHVPHLVQWYRKGNSQLGLPALLLC